ncbi:MAG: aldehyde dehydrogenase (NADP(+)), partial [Rhodanobacter sp.]
YSAADGSDEASWTRVATALRPRVGRLIGNRMPTGVAVSPAMNHGGPYPSTSQPGFTSVGMPAAIQRFSTLHCYDHVPDRQLPPELRDCNPGDVARQIDGRWCVDDIDSEANGG